MNRTVKDLVVPLADYAVVDEDATILDALRALAESQEKLPPDRQPHRAILVRNRRGEIIGKIHHFAFLRALVAGQKARGNQEFMDRAGLAEDTRKSSMEVLDLLTGDLLDLCERSRHVGVREVFSTITVSIPEEASFTQAITAFLRHQTLSLLVTRQGRTVGILRISDLFEELAQTIMRDECPGGAP
jgi:CBS domain containing-hemolysin-like protein